MKKYFLLFVFAVFALQSCRTTYDVSIQPELEQVFIGKSYADIIEAMGAPERVTPDGRDGQILVYEEMAFVTESSMNFWSKNVKSITQSSKGFIQLYMNPSNICYNVKTNRTKEEIGFSKGKTIGLIAGLGGGLATLGLILLSQARK